MAIEGAAARVKRYTMLRSAQRALYPMRPIPNSLPADRALRQIRQRLRAIGPDPKGNQEDPLYATPEARLAALHEVDEMLGEVARDLRQIAGRTSFSELRATLPPLCATCPEEVAALLDLCLEDERAFSGLRQLIDYLVTLLSTGTVDADRGSWRDPVLVTPRLREVCETQTDYDPKEVVTRVRYLEEALAELRRSESVEPVIHRMREFKAQVGRLMLVPDLLRKIVEYNVAVSARIEELLEAERTIQLVDELADTGVTAPTLGSARDDDTAPSIWHLDGTDLEVREGKALFEIAKALSAILTGNRPGKSTASKIAQALETQTLSSWEREAFTSGAGDSDAELLRTMIVGGLLLRQMDEVQPLLAGTGLEPSRLQSAWVPRIDQAVKKVIASSLGGDSYQTAKQLAQTKAKFLFPRLRPRPAEPGTQPSRLPDPSLRPRPARRPRPPKVAPKATRSPGLGNLAVAAGILGLMIAGSMQLKTEAVSPGEQAVATRAARTISPYLESATRKQEGETTRFLGTVTEEWDRTGELFQMDEATRIGDLLYATGVDEVLLSDKRGRLRAHYVKGTLVYPRARAAPSVEFH